MNRTLLALMFILGGCDWSDPEPPPPDPTPPPPAIAVELADHPGIDGAIRTAMEAGELVGVTVGIAQGDTIVFLQGWGLADVENDVAVDPTATQFRWASVSKGLAGIVAVQAQLAGTLTLDAQVSDLLEEYTVPTTVLPDGCDDVACAEPLTDEQRSITLAQLLHHTAGVQHYSNGAVYPVPPILQTDDPAINTGIAWALPFWIDAPLVAVPGTESNYSTFGFNLAGAAVERAVGAPFGEIVRDGIATPLGMDTFAVDRVWDYHPNRAVGYVRVNDNIAPDGDNDVSWKAPGGGFLSSGVDLTRYCAGLQSDLLLPADARDTILWVGDGEVTDYGLGFGVGDALVSHTGAQQKTRTAIAWDRETNTCFTLMTNSTWAEPWALLSLVMDAWNG